MRNPTGPYKHAGENDMNYSRTADSSLLAKRRQNFAEGGPAALDRLTSSSNPSVETTKKLVSDLGLDKSASKSEAQTAIEKQIGSIDIAKQIKDMESQRMLERLSTVKKGAWA